MPVLCAHATLEADLLVAEYGLRVDGLPSLCNLQAYMPYKPPLLIHEDDQPMLRAATTVNDTVRYLHYVHRVSVLCLHEVLQMQEICAVYEETTLLCVDMYIKRVQVGPVGVMPAT